MSAEQRTYEWANSANTHGITAAEAWTALQKIKTANGVLLPTYIVEAAADPLHVFHRFFAWDDAEAARQGRLLVAARIIRNVKVTVVYKHHPPITVRAYSSVKDKGAKSYVPTSRVMSRGELRSQLLAQAKVDMRAFIHKYECLEELAEVVGVMKKKL